MKGPSKAVAELLRHVGAEDSIEEIVEGYSGGKDTSPRLPLRPLEITRQRMVHTEYLQLRYGRRGPRLRMQFPQLNQP